MFAFVVCVLFTIVLVVTYVHACVYIANTVASCDMSMMEHVEYVYGGPMHYVLPCATFWSHGDGVLMLGYTSYTMPGIRAREEATTWARYLDHEDAMHMDDEVYTKVYCTGEW